MAYPTKIRTDHGPSGRNERPRAARIRWKQLLRVQEYISRFAVVIRDTPTDATNPCLINAGDTRPSESIYTALSAPALPLLTHT